MHLRAIYQGILTPITYADLTRGKQQEWLDSQPTPNTLEEAVTQKRVKRLIRLSRDEQKE